MESSLSLQNFQKNGTRMWAINCQQRKGLLFSRKMHSGTRNRRVQASVEWGGLRRYRDHRVKRNKLHLLICQENIWKSQRNTLRLETHQPAENIWKNQRNTLRLETPPTYKLQVKVIYFQLQNQALLVNIEIEP
ncbi:hypothetical protein AVEN_103801-1 [Araneus ventricosus]|uniref:Uncharacterized protein n=1 Tax=Araneus ventricosus TaxID=182803 RepID=A0A4Y2G8U5_ARAVE|nr:hypothetical protein AVEN_103801-1 [Araneus ventricosus]